MTPEISSLENVSRFETQNFDFLNSGFRVSRLKISSFLSLNFEFLNSKFRVYKRKISSSLIRSRKTSYGMFLTGDRS